MTRDRAEDQKEKERWEDRRTGADRKTGRRTRMGRRTVPPLREPWCCFWEGGGQLSSKWHLRSLHLSVAGFLASGFWKHFLCSRQRLACAGSEEARQVALQLRPCSPAWPVLCTSSLLLGRPPLSPSGAPGNAHTESPVPILPRVFHRLSRESNVPYSHRGA